MVAENKTTVVSPAATKATWFDWSSRLFGDDFFISFKLGSPPIGAQSYASDLARRLRELDYTVFFSEDRAEAGVPLNSTLVKALHKSQILVVIANEGALLHSEWVRKEVEEFRRKHPKRRVIPINIDHSIEKFGTKAETSKWLDPDGVIWLDETQDAVTNGITSLEVVKRLILTAQFTRAKTWLRRFVAMIAVILICLTIWAKIETGISTLRKLAAEAIVDLDIHPRKNILMTLKAISPTKLGEFFNKLESVPLLNDALNLTGIKKGVTAFTKFESIQLLNGILNATGGLPFQHDAPVIAVAFSLDDKWLATATENTVKLWDLQKADFNPLILEDQGKPISALAFSPDGHTLATAGTETGVRLWKIPAADKPDSKPLPSQSGKLMAIEFSQDGRWLATASKEGTAQLWDLTSAEPEKTTVVLPHVDTDGKNESVYTVAFSPDNHWLATGADKAVRLWDLSSPNIQTRSKLLIHKQYCNPWWSFLKVAFSPDSQWLAAGGSENYQVMLWRVSVPDSLPYYLDVSQWVGKLAFSTDSRWLATPSQYEAKLWDLSKSDPYKKSIVFPRHNNAIADLGFSPDNKWFATASADHTVQLLNFADNLNHRITPPIVLIGHEDPLSGLAFSHDGKYLATSSNDNTARLWNISSPTTLPRVLSNSSTTMKIWEMRSVTTGLAILPRDLGGGELHPDSINSVTIVSPDGKWIANGGGSNEVHLWDVSTAISKHYLIPSGLIWAAPVFNPDGHWLATGGADGNVKLWNLQASDPVANPQELAGHKAPVRGLAFSPDGHRLVSGARDGFAFVWDMTATDSSQDPIRLASGDVRAVAISTDGRYVVTGSWGDDQKGIHLTHVWDLSSKTPLKALKTLSFRGRVFDVAISPDGRWVTAGSWDTTAQLLDLTKPHAKPFVLRGHTARTLSVAFSPDSQWLATGNEDRTVRLWDLASSDPSADSVELKTYLKVGNVSYSPDGRWLAVDSAENHSNPFSSDKEHWFFASNNPETRVFSTDLDILTKLACRTAGRNWTDKDGEAPNKVLCPELLESEKKLESETNKTNTSIGKLVSVVKLNTN